MVKKQLNYTFLKYDFSKLISGCYLSMVATFMLGSLLVGLLLSLFSGFSWQAIVLAVVMLCVSSVFLRLSKIIKKQIEIVNDALQQLSRDESPDKVNKVVDIDGENRNNKTAEKEA